MFVDLLVEPEGSTNLNCGEIIEISSFLYTFRFMLLETKEI